MESITGLNIRYTSFTSIKKAINLFRNTIASESKNSAHDHEQKLINNIDAFYKLFESVNPSMFPSITDTYALGRAYQDCYYAIEEYKNGLLEAAKKWDDRSSSKITESKRVIIEKQELFDQQRSTFTKKYDMHINSVQDINSAILRCSDAAYNSVSEQIESILAEAKEMLSNELSLHLHVNDELTDHDKLPIQIKAARYPVSRNLMPLLIDLGYKDTYKDIMVDLLNQGNILVDTDYEQMADEKIDKFIIAYIFRFLESFPLGSVNVHIFDANAGYRYKMLNMGFQSANASDIAKKVIQIHSSIEDITKFRDVLCEDIFKQINVDCPDLYSLYETDQSEVFNLVILRNGILDNNGYASAEILSTIASLTRPDDIGHKCGIRFLIIDNSSSFSKNLSSSAKYQADSIRSHCSLQIKYAQQEFICDGNQTETLQIDGNLDAYIQERSRVIEQAISGKEKSYVPLAEVFSNCTEELGGVMYIPVGKSGKETISLPLSCKDESGTVAGQCIGYMAIGQSGSGKSSFFHSVVLNGSWKYSPKDLQFWLLDFKYGGASSKYSNSGLPHVRIIAENNKVDDALCLFQMILEEMDRRNRIFNQYSVNDIVDYNRIASENAGMEYFPRIIIAIDEVQEIFRDDNAAVLQKLISSISVRMRSAGMHFIMVAQNLSEGKSYMLKDAFLPSASGRICFRVAPNIPRDSGFDEEFSMRKNDISELKTGEAYVSYGKDTIKKVKIAFASTEDMNNKYFPEIREKYRDYSEAKPLVIGSKKRLVIADKLQRSNETYFSTILGLKPVNGIYSAVIGEDAYRMIPLKLMFSQHENSSVLLLGSDKEIASSLCISIALSLMRQDAKISIFNADKTSIRMDTQTVPHPFLYLCQILPPSNIQVHDYKLSEMDTVVEKLYSTYLERQKTVQEADDVIPEFSPEFLIINDLFGIESFVNNDQIAHEGNEGNDKQDIATITSSFDFLMPRTASSGKTQRDGFRENIQTILATILRNGFRYNIHLILAINGDPSVWRNMRIASEVNNIIMFNSTQYTEQMQNSYYLREMLKNIANEDNTETMAVWAGKRNYSKIRPIIYNMAREQEKQYIDLLTEGKNK